MMIEKSLKIWLRIWFFLSLSVILGFSLESGAAQGHNVSRPNSDSTASFIRAWVGALDRTDMTDALPMNYHIQELVIRYVEDYVTRKGDFQSISSVDLRRDLEISVFGELKWPFQAMVRTFKHPWKDGYLIGVGYSLRWTDQNRFNAIGLFFIQRGKITRLGLTNFVPGANLSFEIFPPSNQDEFLFLVSGVRKGKSHPRLSLVLYSLKEGELKSLWKRVDIYDGKFQVENAGLRITYLKEEEFIHETRYGRLPSRYEALYSRKGSEYSLEYDKTVPLP